jgi:predicted DNA-binding transcriptional regulator AlpA
MQQETDMMTTPNVLPIPAALTGSLIRKHFVPVGKRTFDRWISGGTFPRADIRMGGKIRMWKRETVLAWLEAQVAASK